MSTFRGVAGAHRLDNSPQIRTVPTWPPLANELWWFLHSEQSGLLQVDSVVASLGLSGALLAELVAARQVFLHDGRLIIDADAEEVVLRHYGPGSQRHWWPDENGEPPPPETAATLLPQIVAEPTPLPVADWLAYLSRDAYERVAERMLATGLVRTARVGRFPRRTAYPPKDVNVSGWARARLRISLERGNGFSSVDRVLIGLCQATGVHRRVFDGVHPEQLAGLTHLRDGLPDSSRELLCRLEVAVAAAVVHRI